ncbi:MAG: hypothetical protein ACREP1_11625 [Rhodanobacteraceae bacterium]
MHGDAPAEKGEEDERPLFHLLLVPGASVLGKCAADGGEAFAGGGRKKLGK